MDDGLKNEPKKEWMKERKKERKNERTDERKKERTDERKKERKNKSEGNMRWASFIIRARSGKQACRNQSQARAAVAKKIDEYIDDDV